MIAHYPVACRITALDVKVIISVEGADFVPFGLFPQAQFWIISV